MPQRSIVKKAKARGPSTKTSVAIPDELWRLAKLRAVEEKKTLGEVIVEALGERLKRGGKR